MHSGRFSQIVVSKGQQFAKCFHHESCRVDKRITKLSSGTETGRNSDHHVWIYWHGKKTHLCNKIHKLAYKIVILYNTQTFI